MGLLLNGMNTNRLEEITNIARQWEEEATEFSVQGLIVSQNGQQYMVDISGLDKLKDVIFDIFSTHNPKLFKCYEKKKN